MKYVKVPSDVSTRFFDASAFYPKVQTLDISDTHIQMIDISRCNKLTELICSRSHLRILDVFNHPTLRKITAKDMPALHNVYLQECTNLTEVTVTSNTRFDMDLRGCVNLTYVNASKSELIDICLFECAKLTFLDCSYTNLLYLDLDQNPLLKFINVSRTPISVLKIRNCSNLQHLFIRGTNIAVLNLMMCKKIITLDIREANNLEKVMMKNSESKAKYLYENKVLRGNDAARE